MQIEDKHLKPKPLKRKETLILETSPFELTTHSQSTIKYGDSIYLGVEGASTSELHLITSFISGSVHMLLTLNKYVYSERQMNPLPDINMSSFEILGPNNSQAQEELSKYKKSIGDREPTLEQNSHLVLLEKARNNEIIENKNQQIYLIGREIKYGDEIQFMHLYSEKCIGISKTKTSIVDRSCLKVRLYDNDGRHVQFRIMPRYKLSNIGDKVRVDDKILLENPTSQQFLNTSSLKLRDSFYGLEPNSFEVNGSPLHVELTIIARTLHDPKINSKIKVHAGAVIRLYHPEDQCYIAAHGCYYFEKEQAITEDVHLRRRKTILGNIKDPSTSAITYWQIENAISPLSGDILKWNESVRFKHMITKHYLAVKEVRGEIVLTLVELNSNSISDTVFVLRPFIDEGDEEIIFSNFARIFHPESKFWIRASSEPYYKNNMSGLLGFEIPWDGAETFQLELDMSRGYHDAFSVEEVDKHLVLNFQFVFGFMIIIRSFLQFYADENTPTNSKAVNKAMSEFKNWIIKSKSVRERKNRQKLLRNTGLIELLNEVLDRFTKTFEDIQVHDSKYKLLQGTSLKMYEVLESYLVGDSRKNENYCIHSIPTFESHFGFNTNAEATLIELIRDNKNIISMLSDRFAKSVHRFLPLLEKEKNFQIFRKFEVMCVANENPIPENQNMLVDLLKANLSTRKYIFLMELDNNKIITQSPFNNEDWNLLSVCIENESNEFKYLCAQLDFFIGLCKGNNEQSIEFVTYLLPFKVVLAGLSDEDLNPLVRSRFAKLMNALFVDVGENRDVLEALTFVFVYQECVENPGASAAEDRNTSLSGVVNQYFPQMHEWFVSFFESTEILGHPSNSNYNQFISSVLDILISFIKFGYYNNNEDTNRIISVLVQHGKSNKYRNETELVQHKLISENKNYEISGYYQDTPTNRLIFSIKIKIIEAIKLYMNFRFLRQLQRCIFIYRELTSHCKTQNRLNEEDRNSNDFIAQHLTNLHKLSFTNIIDNVELVKYLNLHIENQVLSFNEFSIETECEFVGFRKLLLDFTLHECPELVAEALELLEEHYTVKHSLFEYAIQTQLLVNEESISFYMKIKDGLTNFTRHSTASFTNDSQCEDLIEMIEVYTKESSLEEDPSKPNPQKQKILYNFRVFSNLITMITRLEKEMVGRLSSTISANKDQIVDSAPAKLCRAILILLRKLAQGNLVIQKRLYSRLQLLVNDKLLTVAAKELCELITEIFTGAQEIVLKIKPEEIKAICSLLKDRSGLNINVVPLVTEILKAIIKIEELDLPLEHNQAIIMKYFMAQASESIDEMIGNEKEKKEIRYRLLTLDLDKSNPEDISKMNLMLSTYNLMASLCEGHTVHHESICQSMIRVDELLKILNDDNINLDRKTPFASFFNWTYLNISDPYSTIDLFNPEDPEFWKFLTNSNEFLQRLIISIDWIEKSKKNIRVRTSVVSIDAQTLSSLRTLQSGVVSHVALTYMLEGLIPLIITYFTRYFNKTKDSVDEERIPIVIKLGKHLIALSKKLQAMFSIQYQAKLFYNAALAIITHPDIRDRSEINDLIQTKEFEQFYYLIDGENTFQNPAMFIYNLKYKNEIDLNDHYNAFIVNLRRASNGKNTVRIQINGNHNEPYTHEIEGYNDVPGPDFLPLGKEFQEHVSCFFKNTKEKCEVLKYTHRLMYHLKESMQSYNTLSERNKVRRQKLDIKTLQLLRAGIINEISLINPQLKNTNPVQFRIELEKVVHLQNNIEAFGDTVINLIFLTNYPNDQVISQAIAFIGDMLYGGNNDVQKKIEKLAEYREDKFIVKMQQIMLTGSKNLKDARSLSGQVDLRKLERKNMRDVLKTMFGKSSISDTLLDDITVSNNAYQNVYSREISEIPTHELDNIELKNMSPKRIPKTTTMADFMRIQEIPCIINYRFEKLSKKESVEAVSDSNRLIKDAIYHYRIRDVYLAVRMVALMCDNQQQFLQDYMRFQPINIHCINMNQVLVTFLKSVYTCIDISNIELVTQVIKAITEFISGNDKNQSHAVSYGIIDIFNRIFRTHNFKGAGIDETIVLYDSIVRTLQLMIDETSKETKYLAKEIHQVIDIPGYREVLAILYEIRSKNDVKESHRKLAENGMYRLFYFLIRLKDFETISNKEAEKIDPTEKDDKKIVEVWEYCKKSTASVEINIPSEDNESILNKVYFKLDNKFIKGDTKEEIFWNLNRTSHEDKLRDLLLFFHPVKREYKYVSERLDKVPLLKYYFQKVYIRKYLLILWAFICNIFLLATWDTPCNEVIAEIQNYSIIYICDGNVTDIDRPLLPTVPDWYVYAFYPIAIVLCLLTLDNLLLFHISNGAHFYLPTVIVKPINWILNKLLRWQIYKENLNDPGYLRINLFGSSVLLNWVLFLSAFLSIFFQGYFWPLSLFFILDRSSTLKKSLQAVTQNGKALILVGILIAIIIYIFGVIGFALFSQPAQASVDPNYKEFPIFCRTLLQCFVSIARYGLIEPIGLILPSRTRTFLYEIDRIIYDMVFFIAITVVSLNLVLGIIVDTFSELREKKEKAEANVQRYCFICDIENHVFDRIGYGFWAHQERDHNIWNYYRFFIYLYTVDQSDHTPTESFVYTNLQDNKTVFFPKRRARCIKEDVQDNSQEIAQLHSGNSHLSSLI